MVYCYDIPFYLDMFSKKSTISVVIFAFSATILLLIIGVRSDMFQSSLIGNTGSGSTVEENSSGTIMTAMVSDAADLQYRTALFSAYDNAPGVYFPNIYELPAVGEKVNIPIAYKGAVPLSIESQLVVNMTYPSFLSYVGGEGYVDQGQAVTIVKDKEKRSVTVTIAVEKSTILPLEIPSLLDLAFAVDATETTQGEHTFTIGEAYVVDGKGERQDVGFVKEPVGLFANVSLKSAVPSRGVITNETGRGVLTAEQPITIEQKTGPVNAVQQTLPKPIITIDQTRVSPRRVTMGGGDTVFLYLSVSDNLKVDEIKAVFIDLAEVGLGSSLSMMLLEEKDGYNVYATSFILPDAGLETGMRLLPYRVVNSTGGSTEGNLELEIVSPVVKKDVTINVREENIVDIDLTKDGVINADDLELFLDIYQSVAGTTRR